MIAESISFRFSEKYYLKVRLLGRHVTLASMNRHTRKKTTSILYTSKIQWHKIIFPFQNEKVDQGHKTQSVGGQTREVLQSEKKSITNSRGSLHADLPASWAVTGISRLFSC